MKDTKPWLKAQPGEVWALTASVFDSRTDPFYVATRSEGLWPEPHPVFEPMNGSDYPVSYLGLRATVITDGHRIWPEATE